MQAWLERTKLLLGEQRLSRLQKAHVLVVGLGGVGSYAAEQLVRAGVGRITIADGDVVQASNINRQLPATSKTIGLKKSEILKERYQDINPALKIDIISEFIEDHKMEALVVESKVDFVLDAIDTLSPKIHLIKACVENKVPLVSSMGAGARLDPSKVSITDLSKSFNDPLAFKVRKALRKHNIHKGFKVVFSSELVDKNAIIRIENEKNKKSTAGTISYMPAVFGMFCASVAIRTITEQIDTYQLID